MEKATRRRYTLEYKQEAVRLVRLSKGQPQPDESPKPVRL